MQGSYLTLFHLPFIPLRVRWRVHPSRTEKFENMTTSELSRRRLKMKVSNEDEEVNDDNDDDDENDDE